MNAMQKKLDNLKYHLRTLERFILDGHQYDEGDLYNISRYAEEVKGDAQRIRSHAKSQIRAHKRREEKKQQEELQARAAKLKTRGYAYGGYGVDVKLISLHEPGPQFVYWWKKGAASFVLADPLTARRSGRVAPQRGDFLDENGAECDLVSINGLGEIRWPVLPSCSGVEWMEDHDRAAIEHFKLRVNPDRKDIV